jgi:hypothetical protein
VKTAAAILAVAALSLLAAACGGSSGSHLAQPDSSTGPPSSRLLAFSRCMRSHGVSSFPDPNGKGELPKSQVAQLAAGNPEFVPARRACGHLIPDAGQPSGAQVRQAWSDMRNFARCMRVHGVARWPDPTPTSRQDQRPFFRTEEVGIDPSAPQVTAAIDACRHVLHWSNPLVTLQ